MKSKFPYVSFIIPTLNAQKYLSLCLTSIRKQEYPEDKYEILIIDGGSKDRTLNIAKQFTSKIIYNKKVDQETGKSLGINASKGNIIVLMDADNEIIKEDWLARMVKPLIIDPNLFGVESLYFPKKGESIFNTYCMLAHIADPFSRALAAKLIMRNKEDYYECIIPGGSTYPLGANGFLWNKKIIKKVGLFNPKFEESNFSYFALKAGYRKFARISGYGIYHHHIDSLGDFIDKRLKIGNKFLNRAVEKKKTWLEGVSIFKFLLAALYCGTFIGPFVEGFINFIKTKNKAWLLHPLMSFISIIVYVFVFVKRKLY